MKDFSRLSTSIFLISGLASFTLKAETKLAEANILAPGTPLHGLVKRYCIDCHNPEKHKGDIDFVSIMDGTLQEDPVLWEDVAWVLNHREMPPEDKEDIAIPEEAEYELVTKWLDKRINVSASVDNTLQAQQPHQALLDKYCLNCHNEEEKKAGLVLKSIYKEEITDHAETWEKVVRKLHARQMPPMDRKRPGEKIYAGVLDYLTRQLDQHAADHPNPGRSETFRRLNRNEYQNAIRDLLQLNVDATTLLPSDEASHGFDNVTVSNLSPVLMDRYITAAEKISRLAVGANASKPDGYTFRVRPDVTQEYHFEGFPLGTRGGISIPFNFPQSGEYDFAVHLQRDRDERVEGLLATHRMEILIDKALVKTFTLHKPADEGNYHFDDSQLQARIAVDAGPRNVTVTFVQKGSSLLEYKREPYRAHFNRHRHPRNAPAIYEVSINGPYEPSAESPQTPSREHIFTCYPTHANEEKACAKKIISRIAKLAYRRAITNKDLVQPLRFFRQGNKTGGFDNGIEMALSAILVNPNFLFRVERDPKSVKPGEVYRLSDIELASRLSFFLWSSIPDQELLDLAIAGKLKQADVLEAQVKRLLTDPRSQSLTSNFAAQWLYLRNLSGHVPDLRAYPDFDDNLRQAMRKETELFVDSIIRDDRSALDLIQADYTFLNERLAKHYGIPHIYGSRFRKVELGKASHRGGLLRQASILTITSYATRTSPVVRGHWILENFLGTPPPPPPEDVPALEEEDGSIVSESLPVRERLTKHREDPKCASCHDVMDPVGFALENYDAVGRWREREAGKPVDASAGMPDGSKFWGVEGLEKGILKRPELFVRTLTEKLMIFALGRGVEYYDAPAIRHIVRKAAGDKYRFSSLILGIISSDAFTRRKAPADEQSLVKVQQQTTT